MDSSHRRKGAAKQFTNDHQPDGQDGTVREAAVLSTCNSAHGPWVHRAGKTMYKELGANLANDKQRRALAIHSGQSSG